MRFAGMGLIAALAAMGCSSLPSELEPFDGEFAYEAFDDGGTQVLSGTLRLAVSPNGTVTGTWEIERVPGSDPDVVVGPQVGKGGLAGTVEDGTLVVDLNPGASDSNVGLAGVLESGAIVGTWSYVTIAGPTAEGDFAANKIR